MTITKPVRDLRDGDRFTIDGEHWHTFAVHGFGTVSCYVDARRDDDARTYRVDVDESATVRVMRVKPMPQSKDDPYGEELTCDCGNAAHLDGFYASDADGTSQIEEGGGPLDTWDGVHYKCDVCGQVWSMRDWHEFV